MNGKLLEGHSFDMTARFNCQWKESKILKVDTS